GWPWRIAGFAAKWQSSPTAISSMPARPRTVGTSRSSRYEVPRKRCQRPTNMSPGAAPASFDRPATRLLLVNQHYYPDVASTGQHLTDLAEYLASEGYSVEVLTGRGKYVAGRMNAPEVEVRNGVQIRRVRTTSFGRASHLGRIID